MEPGPSSVERAATGEVRAWTAQGVFPEGAPQAGQLLEELFALRPDRWLRRIEGRETFAWPGRAHWIVKRLRGGEARDWWHERLHGGARSPSRREAENLIALAREGLPVPRAVAWVEESAACGHPRQRGRSALVMERVGGAHRAHAAAQAARGAQDLRSVLRHASAEQRRERLAQLLALVQRFHGLGWIHRDLYTQHVQVVGASPTPEDPPGDAGRASRLGELCLLDLGRARPVSRGLAARWWVKDLAALHMSAPATVTRAERWRFLCGWLASRGIDAQGDRGQRARWARRVLRKARRLAAHRPRVLDPADPVDRERLAREGSA